MAAFGADAQGERQHCGHSESRSFSELTEGVTCVLKELLEPGPAPRFASLFSDKALIAEGTTGGESCVFRRHAFFPLFFFFQL